MNIENVRETKREVKKKLQGGGTIYELIVVQEYFEENVKNMLISWEEESKQQMQWLQDYHLKTEETVKQTVKQLEETRDMLQGDFLKTKEEVWEAWLEALKEKKAWVEHFDEHVEKAKLTAAEEMSKLKQQVQNNFESNEKAIPLWKDALQN